LRVVCSILALAASVCGQIPVVTTVAGSSGEQGPVRGFSGDDGPATAAALGLANVQNECDPQRFEQNSHLFVSPAGDLYLADSNNHRIRRVSPEGIITTVVGSGERPTINARCEPTSPIGDGGQARDARLYGPSSVLLLSNGNLIIADQQNNRIRQVTPAGIITTIAGSGAHNLYAPGIPAIASPMDWPGALAVDAEGQIYFTELHGNRIGRINTNGRLSTIAGNGFPGSGGDGAQATLAQLRRPAGIAIDRNGVLYIADTGNHRIRRVTAGVITTIAGTGTAGFSGDGESAVSAMLDNPMDVKVDSRGNVYIADTGNHRVRRIDSAGVITTLGGNGDPGAGADYTAASESSFNSPSALAIDSKDDLYIVDWQNYQIRKVTLGGQPAISPGGVLHAASLAPFPAPVAPGSLIVIRGLNLAPEEISVDKAPWPAELGGVSVQWNGTPIPLSSISATQIAAQAPVHIEAGIASITVRTPTGSSNAMNVRVELAAPGIYPRQPEPVERGGTIVLRVTGIGAVTPAVEAGHAAPEDPLAIPLTPLTATIAGVEAEVLEVSLIPGTVGLAQVKLRIPTNIDGGELPVVIRMAGQESNVATIAVR